MAEKKMTQVEALEIAAAALEDGEAKDILAGMIAKRKAPRKPRENKEAIAFAETVAEFLGNAEGPVTNADISAALSNGAQKGEEGYVSFQKVGAALKRLVADGRVTRIEGEKAKDKATFVLA